jgi:probable FeS assembly SUF system protein SufT
MHDNGYKEVTFSRDCEVIQIPSGEKLPIKAGTTVVITQSLGGSYTIATDRGLARVIKEDADAIGMQDEGKPVAAAGGENVPLEEKAVWDQLKTCYDPEIPVNIVDLGLVYDCTITPQPEAGAKVNVKMTLTAPGCGMGPTICSEAKSKILSIPGVADADVDLVWDPPWNQSMISEVGKMQLGLI